VSGEYRQTPLELLAVAGRALRQFAATHQRLEFVVALLAGIFEQRHTSILPLVGAILCFFVGAILPALVGAVPLTLVGASSLTVVGASSLTLVGARA
jgi:hypothetical protein